MVDVWAIIPPLVVLAVADHVSEWAALYVVEPFDDDCSLSAGSAELEALVH